MGPKERKEREKAERRDEIINAGEKLFLEKGLAGATMDEIAREVELSKGTLYLYFPSKEELFLEITHRAIATMLSMMRNAIENEEGVLNRLEKFGEAHGRFTIEHPDHFQILMRTTDYSLFRKPELKELGHSILANQNEIWKMVTDIIRDGIDEGLFKADTDPLEVSISLWSISTMMMQMTAHVNINREMLTEHNDPFLNVDFDSIIIKNCHRIIESILAKIPDGYE